MIHNIPCSALVDLTETSLRLRKRKESQRIEFNKEKECNDFTIIIPTYNSEKFITKTLKTLEKYKDKIIIVDDASTDRTTKVVETLGFQIVKLEKNRKKIGAIWKGLERVKTSYTIIIDSDSFPKNPENLGKLVNVLKRKDWDACAVTVLPENSNKILSGLQFIEYFLAMSIGRQSMKESVPCISGAFGVFKMDILKKVTEEQKEKPLWEGEDFERTLRILEIGGKVGFVENFVVFTKCPETIMALTKQRILWSHGYLRCHLKFIKLAKRKDRLGLTLIFNILVNILFHPLKLFSLPFFFLLAFSEPTYIVLFYFIYLGIVSYTFKKVTTKPEWQRYREYLLLYYFYSLFLLIIPTTIGYLRALLKSRTYTVELKT